MTGRILLGAVLLVSTNAVAGEPAVEQAQAKTGLVRSERPIAVTASFLRPVAARMGEIGGELNIKGKMAVQAAVGLGPGRVDVQDMAGNFNSEDVFCAVFSGKFRYYVLGNFDRGLYVGGEAVYFYLNRDQETSVAPKHEGLWIGPHIGYKHTFDFGLLLSAGITAGVPIYKSKAGIDEDQVPGGIESDHPMIGPILLGPNASVGWAF